MRLILASFWILLGAAFLFYDFRNGGVVWRVDFTDSVRLPAWIAFALGAYNLFRWWLDRSVRAQQRAAYELELKRQASHRRPRTEEEEPNPDFDFKNSP